MFQLLLLPSNLKTRKELKQRKPFPPALPLPRICRKKKERAESERKKEKKKKEKKGGEETVSPKYQKN